MLVVQLEKPVQTDAADLISLVFLVISLEEQPEGHLVQVSKIAKFISSEKHRMASQLPQTPPSFTWLLPKDMRPGL